MKALLIDIETKNLELDSSNRVWSLTVSYDGKKGKIFANPNGLKRSEIPKDVVRDLESEEVLKIGHNLVFDGSVLLFFFGIKIKNLGDTMLNEIVILGTTVPLKISRKKTLTKYEQKLVEAYSPSLAHTLARYHLPVPDKQVREAFIDRPDGIKFSKTELDYMLADVLPLGRLYAAQNYILERDSLTQVALLENKYLERRIEAKARGINFDKKIWRKIAEDNGKEFERRLSRLPYEVENWNSEKQVKAYFRRKGINIVTYKSSQPDVDDLDTLYLETRDEELGAFILYRELHKAVTSYGLSWFTDGSICEDGRIRPDVSQIKETGRVSMSNPNLQQLPGYGRKDYAHDLVMSILYAGEDRLKPQHRRAFIPDKGNVFVIADFSGQEIGIMAAASKENLWIDAMLRGDDVHSLTASLLYKSEWEQGAAKGCTFPKKCSCPNHKTPRERAKILNFMLAYGGGATRFQKLTGLDAFEAKVTVARYKRVVPKLTAYLDRNGRLGENTGESFSADPYRRRRRVAGDRVVTQSKNNPIQAAGANMLKLAAISIPDKYYIPLEIHDEIILEVKRSEAAAAKKVLESVMNRTADYITGIKGLVKAEARVALNLMKDAGQKGLDLYGDKLKQKK